MHKITISRTSFYALIIGLNFVLQGISYGILKFVHNETLAIGFEVFTSLMGNGLLVYLYSEEAPTAPFYLKNFFKNVAVLDKAFFVFAITAVNALAQLVSTILPVYIHNTIEVGAITIFLSILADALVVYLSTEEQTAPQVAPTVA